MNFRTLIFRSLRFHWRAHLGVLLGAAVGSAALIGALIVGDSVRGSLRDMALQRLGWVQFAMAPNDRFFTAYLQHRYPSSQALPSRTAALLRLPATVSRQDGAARANYINLLGIDVNFAGSENVPLNSVLINEALAVQLQARPGDELIFRLPKLNALSRDVPVSPQSDSSTALRLKVHGILKASDMGNFSLQPSQVPPLNAFARVNELEQAAGLQGKRNLFLAGEAAGTTPGLSERLLQHLPIHLADHAPKKVSDAIFVAKLRGLFTETEQEFLNRGMRMSLADVECSLTNIPQEHAIELRSARIFLDPPIVKPTESIPRRQPILSYFVNQFRAGTNTTPYSMITAAGQPWTPSEMKDDEIMVNQWLAEDLKLKPGDSLDITYFLPESAANLVEMTNRFRVRGIVPLEGIYADRTLMPEFPGIAKAESTQNWDAGFPLVHKIREKDEDYWKKYRGTPKAFVTLAAGQKMWGNRFGNLTAIRWPVPPGIPSAQFPSSFESNLLARLKPADFGLRFEPVRAQAFAAANQGQDFGQLFLGFSFFLILAALILMALLFQFGLEQRIAEVGTLLAVGFTPKQVRRVFLAEAAVLAFIGGVIGVLGGAGYAWAMLQGLTGIWQEAVNTSALNFHASASTILIGLCASTIISTLTIALVLRKQAKRPARELLTEGAETQTLPVQRGEGHATRKTQNATLSIAVVSVIGALALVIWGLSQSTTAPGLFFGSGALLLIAGLAFSAMFLALLNRSQTRRIFTVTSLGIRGSTRRRKRSLATIALLACGSFIIVAVGANRLEADRDAQKRSSGTGGFALIGSSTLPVVHDLNTERGRDFFGLDAQALTNVQLVPLRVHAGDDASCLNLNRAQKPRLLGVSPALLAQRHAFTFANVIKGRSVSEGWELLNAQLALTNTQVLEVPAIGDQNSILWAMGKKVGDTIDYVDERGQPFRVRIVGAIANSILQGSLLISEDYFRARFPGESGYRMFLVDAPSKQTAAVSSTLTRALQDVGLELTPAAQRLAEFNAVQNTYLNTFQILGGLGLLLGSAGLGLVVLRNVLERRGELALLKAVGFRQRMLQWLVLSEHGGLLALGLLIGITAAVVAILPVLLSPGAQTNYVALVATLATVFINGLIWTALATRFALRSELLAALRNE